MATPDGTAVDKLSISNPRGSKRGACDRCRGQKLRCLRDEQSQDHLQAPCIRCSKAGAICSFGISKRAGRPPASHAANPQQRRVNGGGKSKEAGVDSRLIANTSGHNGMFDKTADRESEEETENSSPVQALSPSSLHETSNLGGVNFHFPQFSGSSSAALALSDEALPSLRHDNDAGEFSGLDTFGSKYNWDYNTYEAQPMDLHMPTRLPTNNNGESRDVGVNTYRTPAHTYTTNAQISGASDEVMDLDWPDRSADIETFSPTKALNARPDRARDMDRQRVQMSASFGMSSTAESAMFRDLAEDDIGTSFDGESVSVSKLQHRRVEGLSKLEMKLYVQLAANDPENHQPTSGATAKAFQGQLVGNVLKSSDTFLELLKSFPGPNTHSSSPFPHAPPTPSINQDSSTCGSSDSGASPSASTLTHDDSSLVEWSRSSQRKLPAGSSDDSKPPPPTDMTTVLQLLTCYLRIIHLHSIMHARLLDYMLAFFPPPAQQVDSVPPVFPDIPPVFPGMQIGGVSLDKFAPFQVKIVLQTSIHLLGEIELALGLPEEYMIAKKRRKGGGKGVLEASVSGGFVKRLMKEEGWKGKRVECVRERLRNLRQVLKGAVDFQR